MMRRPAPESAGYPPSVAMDSERPARPPNMTRATKVRLRFAKCGDLRFVSHLDLLRCLERMIRRAHVPIAVTQGFNPRPKMTFGLALGLGIEARREIVDLELLEPWEPSQVLERLTAVAPPGFNWVEARLLPSDAAAPRPRSVEYEVPVAGGRLGQVRAALDALLSAKTWPHIRRRRDREQVFDLRRAARPGRVDGRGFAPLPPRRGLRWLGPAGGTARGPQPPRFTG